MVIHKASYLVSSPSYDKCPKPDKPEYAFIGRSNVGKSSLINMLTGQRSLAKTSGTPGKTQMINHFIVESGNGQKGNKSQWYVVDLPGYGYAKRSQSERRKWEQMIENYFRKRENLTQVFVLVDSRHEPQNNDLAFIQSLDGWGVPFSVVFTKTDKEKPKVVERNIKAFSDALIALRQFLPRYFVTSAEKKIGREEVLDYIESNL